MRMVFWGPNSIMAVYMDPRVMVTSTRFLNKHPEDDIRNMLVRILDPNEVGNQGYLIWRSL